MKIKWMLILSLSLSCSKQKIPPPQLSDGQVDLFSEFKQIVTLQNPFSTRNGFADLESERRKKLNAAYDEQVYLNIENNILDLWKTSFLNKDIKKLDLILNDNLISQSFPSTVQLQFLRKFENINEYSWNKNNQTTSKEQLLVVLKAYLESYSEIESVEMSTLSMRSNQVGMRDEASNEMMSVELGVFYDLRGKNKDQEKRNDRGNMVVEVVRKNVNTEWKINRIEFIDLKTLVAENTNGFKNVTKDIGLNELKIYQREEAIRRGGYALSVSDINQDGALDLFVGNYKESEVFLGNSKGHFVKDEKNPLTKETLVKTAVFADFNNNGKKDVLLVRFDAATKDQHRHEDVKFYEQNKANVLEPKEKFNHVNRENFAMPAAVADFNQDSFLDVYVGYPGAQDFTFFDNQRSSNNFSKAQGLYLNEKGRSFKDYTKNIKHREDHQICCDVFPHSALAVDFNQDGKSDIVVIDDSGALSPMYVNQGDALFNQSAKKYGLNVIDYGMTVSAGDSMGEGVVDLLYSSVNFNAATRLNNSYFINYNSSKIPDTFTEKGFQGLKFYKAFKNQNGNLSYVDMTEAMGLDFSGEGLAGAEFVDYNNDGLLDIYVTNGLWSGTSSKKSSDISSLYIRSGLFITDILEHLKAVGSNYEGLDKKSETISPIMKILKKFKNEEGDRPSLAGHQRNRMFRNNGDGTYTEIGYLLGVDSLADGYIVALADLNKDGKMDLILRNADPGVEEVKFSPVEVFLNETKNEHSSVILTFEGKDSNRDAIGTLVKAKIGNKSLSRQLVANNGTAQFENLIHIGLGKNKKIDEIEISWPSGLKEKIHNISNGRYHIVEGKKNAMNLVSMNEKN